MSRARTQQPQYDFLSGGPPDNAALSATSRIPVRAANAPDKSGSDQANEELRAQVHRLQYEIESLKQERDLASVRYNEDLRAAQARAEADFKRAQASESSSHAASSKYDVLTRELEDIKEQAETQRSELERQLRTLQERNRSLEEETDEARNETSSQERQFTHDIKEMQTKLDAAQRSAEELRSDAEQKAKSLLSTQTRLSESEARAGELEKDMMQLKTQSGDADTLAVIKRELSDQVAHIQKLEAENTDLKIEAKRLGKTHKAVEVVEEEKRQLEGRIRMMEGLRKELDEAHLQRQILQDEKRAWTAYLDSAAADGEDVKFNSPEDLAKAYLEERLERASLIDQLGKITPEVAAKDENIQSLEDQLQALREENQQLRSNGAEGAESKSKQRLERQRTLAQKEVEYLRTQLKAYDDEQAEFTPEKHDSQKSQRISELESAVDQYRKEMESLHADLSRLEEPGSKDPAPGTKRRREDSASDERVGELRRKTKTMQAEIDKLSTSRKILKKELEASKTQVDSLKASSQRVLELRNNPTAEANSIKMHTLNTLRAENVALLAQLEKRDAGKAMVPQATLERLRADVADRDRQLAEKDKFMKRHRDVFAAKGLEFKQAVASLLGWDLTIMPNGRVRVASIFYSGRASDDDDEPPGSIVFDGEKQTMKVSGGPKSAFAKEIQDQIKFWVDGRNEIPCFLAACTLEFYDRTTRAQKI